MNFPYKALMFFVLLMSQPVWAEEASDVPADASPVVSESAEADQGFEFVEQLGLPDSLGDTDIAAAESDVLLAEAEQPAHDLSPWGMYQAADKVVKTVMIVLLLASVLTWSVWMTKLLQFAGARRRLNNLHVQVAQAGRLDELKAPGTQTAGGMLLKEMQDELAISRQHAGSSDEGIKERAMTRLQRIQTREASAMTSGMGVLATVGAVAPFVGLFGTVWGIMNSFIAIAHAQTTNLAVVAPGIAEALLATAMGLIAAIPAVVIYNHFARKIASYRALLTDVSMGLMVLLSRDLDEGRFQTEHQAQSPSQVRQISEVISA